MGIKHVGGALSIFTLPPTAIASLIIVITWLTISILLGIGKFAEEDL